MNPQVSKAIFGVGIVLSIASIASIYISMLASQNQDQNTQGSSSQPSGASSDSSSTASPSATGTGTSISITIPNGAAAQASSLSKDYYKPMAINVPSGSRVTWTNQDMAAHTSTSGQSNNSPNSGQLFNTGTIAPGSSGSAIVTGSGNIQYHCTFHPWMIASLQITGSDQAPGVGSTPANANVGTAQQRISAIPTVNDSRLKVTEVISNLSMPTTIAFLGPDDFLLLQKDGTVSRVTNGTLLTPPLLNVTVGTGMTQGMLGVATSNYNNNSKTNPTYVFLYYTEVINKNQTSNLDENQSTASEILQNRVYRYELVDNKLTNPKLLAVFPAKEGYMDNGGYLKIGPDNNLYFSVGAVTASDVSDIQTLTQNFVNGTPVDGRAGILRMAQDGDPVLDKEGRNLLGDSSPLNLYYGYGLKDSFGMDFDPVTGNLWDAEPGRIINDEINLINPGFNGGFEAIQGQSVYTPAAPADLVNFNGSGIYRDPEFVWTQKVVPVGLTFLTSEELGTNYENDMFVGSFLNGEIYHFDLNEDRSHLVVPSSFVYNTMATWNSTGASEITFGKGFGGISSLTVGPDGYLYVVSFGNGVIYKILPSQL